MTRQAFVPPAAVAGNATSAAASPKASSSKVSRFMESSRFGLTGGRYGAGLARLLCSSYGARNFPAAWPSRAGGRGRRRARRASRDPPHRPEPSRSRPLVPGTCLARARHQDMSLVALRDAWCGFRPPSGLRARVPWTCPRCRDRAGGAPRSPPMSGARGPIARGPRRSAGQAHDLAVDLDEPVAPERRYRLEVEVGEGLRAAGQRAERDGPPLAERALERALPPLWLEAAAAGRAASGEWAGGAAGDPGQADRGAQIHERRRRVRRERRAGAVEEAADVRVDGENRSPERESRHRVSRVAAHARQLGEILRPAARRDAAGRAMEIERAPVVAESLPLRDDVGRGRRGERLDGRPALEPGEVARDHARDLRLLQHHLADEDRVRIPRVAPGEIASVAVKPSQKQRLHDLHANRAHRPPPGRRPSVRTVAVVARRGRPRRHGSDRSTAPARVRGDRGGRPRRDAPRSGSACPQTRRAARRRGLPLTGSVTSGRAGRICPCVRGVDSGKGIGVLSWLADRCASTKVTTRRSVGTSRSRSGSSTCWRHGP